MRLQLTFEVGDEILPSALARILLDVQHQAMVFTLMAEAESEFGAIAIGGRPGAEVRRYLNDTEELISYKYMAEASQSSFGRLPLEVGVTRLRMESPLWVETTIRAARGVVTLVQRNFRTLHERVYFGDLERERRRIQNAASREEVIAARIRNIDAAYDLSEKISDAEIREALRRHLISAVAPFDPVLSNQPPYNQDGRRLIDAKVLDGEQERDDEIR
jgi:hypothetical protein